MKISDRGMIETMMMFFNYIYWFSIRISILVQLYILAKEIYRKFNMNKLHLKGIS